MPRETFGWDNVALLCGHEMNKPGALPMCLRILLHVNTEKAARDIKHIYLKGARSSGPISRASSLNESLTREHLIPRR